MFEFRKDVQLFAFLAPWTHWTLSALSATSQMIVSKLGDLTGRRPRNPDTLALVAAVKLQVRAEPAEPSLSYLLNRHSLCAEPPLTIQ